MLLITPIETIEYAFIAREKITPPSIRAMKIDIAQEHFIRPRLGDQFFQELCNGQHAELNHNYIKPSLAHFVRYGLIQELAIEVGDRGALVYSASEGQSTSNQDQQNTEKQNLKQDQTVVKSALSESTLNDKQTKDVRAEKFIDQSRILNNESSYQETGTVTDQNHHTDTIERTTLANDSGNEATKITKEDTGNKTELTVLEKQDTAQAFRAATQIELRALMTRSLADANILLAKAVRHIERNIELYPSYIPSSFSNRLFI